jgi:hypothetical protein
MTENYFKKIKGDKDFIKNEFQINKVDQKIQNMKRPKSAGSINKDGYLSKLGNKKVLHRVTYNEKEKALEIRKNLHTFLNQQKGSNKKDLETIQINSDKDKDKKDNKNINYTDNYTHQIQTFSNRDQ